MPKSKLALVTGASKGIGLELARCCAEDGHALVLCSHGAGIEDAAAGLRRPGVEVETVQADLGTDSGREELLAHLRGRSVSFFFANAGLGLGDAFLDQDFGDIRRVIDLNVTGTTVLLHEIGGRMRAGKEGRILITGSIGGLVPGSFHAVYNATKAYLDNLSWALRNELRDSGVTVTCLMPGPTQTEFFAGADMENTALGREIKDDPVTVAREGYAAMMRGASGVAPTFLSKVQATFAGVLPDAALARLHRLAAEPGATETRGG